MILACVVGALTWLPFLFAGGIPDYLRNIANYQDRFFPFLSVEAWNFWGLIQERAAGGHFVLDSQAVLGPLTPRLIGLLMTFGAEALIALESSGGRRTIACSWAWQRQPSCPST